MSSPESIGKFKREMEGQFPGRPIAASVVSQPPADFAKANRRKRCGQCEACKVKENCNTCKNCINRKILKQTCILRRCHFLHHKPSLDSAERKRKNQTRSIIPKKKPEEPPIPIPEPKEEVSQQPEEPNILSSDEIEMAVNSLLEDSNKITHSEEEAPIPDKIFTSQPPIITKISTCNRKSFPQSAEVLRSSSLLKKQSETSGVSFKIAPSNGSSLRLPAPPPQYPLHSSVMIMNAQSLPKYEMHRPNFVFARVPRPPPPEEFTPPKEYPSPIISTPLPPSSSFDFPTPKVHRRKRCGQCRPCLIKENCMKCKNCINRKVLKQTCIHRKCLYLREKIRKESGFCSSPIVESQATAQTAPAQFHLYDTPLSTPQQIPLQPTVFIAEHYDQPRFRQLLQPKHPDIPGRVNFIPQGHVFQAGQPIQLWQSPYSNGPFPQALPMIATPQGNYTVQLRPQPQYLINPHEGQPRYYVHPSVTHLNPLPTDFTPMNRMPSIVNRPTSLSSLKVEATENLINDARDPSSS